MEKYLIFIIIGIIVYTMLTCEKKRVEVEGFSNQLNDLEAIRTLAMAARDLQAGGLNVKGNLTVADKLQVGGVIARGGNLNEITTGDLGLYSNPAGHWVRYVSNNAPHVWWSDYNKGTKGGDGQIMTLHPNGRLNVRDKFSVGGASFAENSKDIVKFGSRDNYLYFNDAGEFGRWSDSANKNLPLKIPAARNKPSDRQDRTVTEFNDINGNNAIIGHTYVAGNLNIEGAGSSLRTDNLCIGNTCINEQDLKKMKSSVAIAGYIIDGDGTTHLVFEGEHYLTYHENGEAFWGWINDRVDNAYALKGWKITFYEHGLSGKSWVIYNNNRSVGALMPPRGDWNKISSYKAEWIGY